MDYSRKDHILERMDILTKKRFLKACINACKVGILTEQQLSNPDYIYLKQKQNDLLYYESKLLELEEC